MKIVERHIIKKTNPNFKEIDNLCFLSKNLYNVALYTLKKHYEETGKHLSFFTLDKQLRHSNQVDYIALPPNTSQQILMIVEKNYKSFFHSITAYKKNSNKFLGIPKPPKYKKKDGRNIISFSINQAKLKKNQIFFPKRTKLLPITTKVDNLHQVRIIPKLDHYVIEVVYSMKEVTHDNINYNKHIAIDLGLNNLAAVVSDQQDVTPILISGRILKSINQYYNKKKAELQSKLSNGKKTSHKLISLVNKRNRKVDNYMHKVSKYIINHAITNGIGNIIIGYNKEWKQGIELGKRNNQNFVQIPFLKLINMIRYKAELNSIVVTTHEESYTSKCSALDLEPIKKCDKYKGTRTKRGLFKTSTGMLINADINGALNILRKATNDVFLTGTPVGRGLVVNPLHIMIGKN